MRKMRKYLIPVLFLPLCWSCTKEPSPSDNYFFDWLIDYDFPFTYRVAKGKENVTGYSPDGKATIRWSCIKIDSTTSVTAVYSDQLKKIETLEQVEMIESCSEMLNEFPAQHYVYTYTEFKESVYLISVSDYVYKVAYKAKKVDFDVHEATFKMSIKTLQNKPLAPEYPD